MRICERQRLGALTFLIATITVYGVTLFHEPLSRPRFSIPWGELMAGTRAVQVSGSPSSDGVYFLPMNISLTMMKKEIGIKGVFEPCVDDACSNDHSAVAISIERGVPKMGTMPAPARLALGIPIDINHASAEELSLVPGMGEKLGARIYQLRFSRGKIASLSELTAVPGIKEKKLDSLKKYLTVGSIR